MKGTLAIGSVFVMLMGAAPAGAMGPIVIAPAKVGEPSFIPVRLVHPGKTKCTNVIHLQGMPGSPTSFKWCPFSGSINGRSYEARRDEYRLIGGSIEYRPNSTLLYDCDTDSDVGEMPRKVAGSVC